jgi:hypothetical protein
MITRLNEYGCEIDDDVGQRLLRIVRRGTGWAVTWRRAPMVLLSAQSMDVAKIAGVHPVDCQKRQRHVEEAALGVRQQDRRGRRGT